MFKHLKPVSDDREYLKVSNRLFTSEAQILAKLGDHDRIPRLLAYFEQAGEFYLVEEFVEGRSLELELVRGYRMGEAQVIQILDDLLSILEYIHGQGVIHRDLKPDNIIRRKSDGKFVLIDFGAIKQVQNQMTQEGQTVATVAIGTLGYMPSEQAQGKPRPSSDLYAIGVIGIQALTGLPPRELQEDYQTGELIWQHLVPNKTGLVEVLTKMTRYHYKDRYESAVEIRKVLATLGSHHLPTHQSVQSTNGIQSTVVSTNYDLGTELLPKVPPTQPYNPVIAPNPIPSIQPLIQPLPASTTPLPPPTTPVNLHPVPSENPPQYTVQVSTPDQTGDNKGSKGLWIAVWVAAFATAVAIGALMATLNASNNLNPVANNPKPTVTPSQNTTSATSSSTSIETASPTANPKTSPSATVNPTPSQTNANKKNEIAPLSESEAVDLVNNLVAAKNQIFAPPFDRQLLAEFTTGEAYEKRKGSIDWLQSNNAFYSYGDFKVSRAGSFGIQDNQANVTVEIFESPTLYVNGRIDQSQSQPSRGRYVCTFLFENGRWKVSNLTKVD